MKRKKGGWKARLGRILTQQKDAPFQKRFSQCIPVTCGIHGCFASSFHMKILEANPNQLHK